MPQMSSVWWTYLMVFFWFSWMMFTIWLGFWWRVAALVQASSSSFFFFFFFYGLTNLDHLVMNFFVVDGLVVFKFNI